MNSAIQQYIAPAIKSHISPQLETDKHIELSPQDVHIINETRASGTSPKEVQAIYESSIQRDMYQAVRARTMSLVKPLSAEDMQVQSCPDCSPTKWHLAHTTWFFETFFLLNETNNKESAYREFDPLFRYLFNSYYESLGPKQLRSERGVLTRPTLSDIIAYRSYVDEHMIALIDSKGVNSYLFALGLAHEEQHQELILTDILHMFSRNALLPTYSLDYPSPPPMAMQEKFIPIKGGQVCIGSHSGDDFSFDNEGPAHTVFLQDYELSNRLVSNGDWIEFIQDGGYSRPDLWLSDGWAAATSNRWNAPSYWSKEDGVWRTLTLNGSTVIDPRLPVQHISYYEADAYARWRDKRLPTEQEWEHAIKSHPADFSDAYLNAWQWTASAYLAYPGFKPSLGAVGEYNGKFMVNQMVLRGGSIATAPGHSRSTYRNFFNPDKRWQFSGLRLASNLPAHPSSFSHKANVVVKPIEGSEEFLRDVLDGLTRPRKRLDPKYFYDDIGSELFEDITRLPEYYPARVETSLLKDVVHEIASCIPPNSALIEFGSGASVKTSILLNACSNISIYTPMDISVDAIRDAELRISTLHPNLKVCSVVADFTQPFSLPHETDGKHLIGFFPGSTLGNFTPESGVLFLRMARRMLGCGGELILGVDMVKPESILIPAYDDAQGVTAAFNKNILVRMNKELHGNFDLDSFHHRAIWNSEESRIEMHLESLCNQKVNLCGREIIFKEHETLHTENSHKFSLEKVTAMVRAAGWSVKARWEASAPTPFTLIFLD